LTVEKLIKYRNKGLEVEESKENEFAMNTMGGRVKKAAMKSKNFGGFA